MTAVAAPPLAASAAEGDRGLLYTIHVLLTALSVPSLRPAATPLWKSGQAVIPGGQPAGSSCMMALVGGTLPARQTLGMGRASARRGSHVPKVSIPLPTQLAIDLLQRSRSLACDEKALWH